MKTVSIVIPVYNEEKHIKKAITAALEQTYPISEILVIDNNSTDTTAIIVKEFLKKTNQVRFIHEPCQGLIFARQCGLDAVKAEFYCQLDADCIPHKNWVTNAIKYFDNESVVGITGPYYYYDAPLWLLLFTSITQFLCYRIHNWYLQKKKLGAVLIGGNAIIRTKALRAAGGYNLNLHFYAEDGDTALRLSRQGRVLYCQELSMPTSARRYTQLGFWNVLKKYRKASFMIKKGKKLLYEDTVEYINPR